MITIKNLSYAIGGKTLVEPISIALEERKLHIILGANGAGKSTLIKLLSGQLKPTTGAVYYNDRKLETYKTQELATFRAVLSQSVDFAFPLCVDEVVMMGRYPHFTSSPRKIDREIVAKAMEKFSITELQKRDYNTLSGGEKQRVQFARILSQIWPEDDRQRLLFLDEPLTYLDVKYQYDFLHQMRSFLETQNLCIIGVLHDINLGARFADNLVLLHQARLVAHGNPNTVLTQENIQKLYELEPHFIQGKKGRYIEF